jgi:hypothetical protein
MEDVLGEGGWDALRDAGGLTAVVREAGRIVVGDGVRVVDVPRPAASRRSD